MSFTLSAIELLILCRINSFSVRLTSLDIIALLYLPYPIGKKLNINRETYLRQGCYYRPMKLTEIEIQERLVKLTGWERMGEAILREFVFRDFVSAFGFMASAALIAEKLNHHPEWSNVNNRVSVKLSTHEAGGLSELDFDLAERLNRLV